MLVLVNKALQKGTVAWQLRQRNTYISRHYDADLHTLCSIIFLPLFVQQLHLVYPILLPICCPIG